MIAHVPFLVVRPNPILSDPDSPKLNPYLTKYLPVLTGTFTTAS